MKLTKPQLLIYDSEKVIGGSIAVMCGIMTVDKAYPEAQVVEAVKKIYETNDALNYKLDESGSEPQLYYESPYGREVNVIRVESLSELDAIGEREAKTPFDKNGWLSELTAVIRPDGYGIIIKVHHLLGDAWSMSLIASQLNDILEGTPWVRCSYEKYVDSEQDYLNSKRYLRSRRFFLEAFGQCSDPVLLSDRQSSDYSVEKLYRHLPTNLRERLNEYSERKDVSEFIVLFSAVAVLYGKLKNCAESFFLGMPVLNRASEEEMNTVGMYINTVPVPVILDYELSLNENLKRIQDGILSAFKHQKYNYNDILKAVNEEYGFRGRLYDCAVNYQPDEINSKQIMRSKDYSRWVQAENLQLFFHNRNHEAELSMEYDFRRDIFSAEDIERFHEELLRVLETLVTDGELPLRDVSILGEAETERIINSFNDTFAEYDKTKSVCDLFIEQTKRGPERTAVIAVDRTLTYSQLEAEAARLAKGLTERGIKTGDIVAFRLPRDSRLISTMLGILRTGAAYLPLDTQQPRERLDYILKDSCAKLCITEEIYDKLLAAEPLKQSVKVSPEDICYCIYTSGSTGMPKGTLLTHQNVMNYIGGSDRHINGILGKKCETFLSVTSVGFDIFVTESLLPLANGKSIVLADERQSQFGAQLQALLQEHPADVIQTTPSKIRVFLQNMSDKTCLKALKCVVLGGETLDKSLSEELQALTDARIYNVYGPTEATVWATCAALNGEESITIGKPLANTRVYILDKYLMPVPVGATGELCIAGDCVAEGYLNRPELTAERFVNNPFGVGKLYRTGDLACWREDGNIVFVGRDDFQVKINGQRVELGEIEEALTSLEGIDGAVTVVRKDETDSQILCAFYTGKEIAGAELRSMLSRSLPRYMLPQAFVHLDSMPLNMSGKIDRNALSAVEVKTAEAANEYVAPQTKEEIVLISTATQVLGAERIGMRDNFFDLGGDSLKSIAWISLLEQQGYTLSASDVFSCADMSELKEKLRPTEKAEEAEPDYPKSLPLTVAQKEIYTAQSIAPDKPAYNIPFILKVQSLDVGRLQNAVDRMLWRHEILRMRFENDNGKLTQTVDENARCKVESIEGDITDFIRPFDLSRAPLIRVGYKDNVIVFDLHHLVADGSSMPVFFRELNDYYMGREPQNAFLPYKYFAVKQKASSEDEAYWSKLFNDGAPSLDLRTDIPRPAVNTYDGKTLYHNLPKETDERIASFCKERNVTPFVYYFGAFQILLQKYSGQEDIVVGTPMSRRNTKNLGTVGMFVHTLPMRCRPEGNKTVMQFLNEVRELSITAARHTEIAASDVAASAGRPSLFDVMFTYQAEEMTSLQFADAPAELEATPLTVSKYDFDFSLYPRKDGSVLSVTYNTSLFRENTMERMMRAYETVLAQLSDADKRISELTVLDEAETDEVLNAFNDTVVEYDKTKSVYDLFSESLKESDLSAFIKDETDAYTFAQLDSDAAKVDAFIRNAVGASKQVIGVLCERSYEELAAIFGIIRGGNAYMPISPQYPDERIKTMLETSGCQLVIAQKEYCHLTDCAYAVEDILASSECETVYEPAAKPEDTLYVIYTSGSTGVPKGAMVTNRSIVNRIRWMTNRYFDKTTVVMRKTPYTFDVSVWEIFGFAMFGFSLYILPPDEHYNQKEVLKHIEKGRVTDLHFVPTVFGQFLSVLRKTPDAKHKLRSLRNVILSGESLSAKDVNEFSRYHDGTVRIHNLYGPAECAVDVTAYDCAETETDPVPIGKPIDNTQIYVVDKYMKPVPVGVTGELCIGGDNVGQGYLNRPELTAERFVDNPFGEGRIYKTGDLAYRREDGNIVFVGRNDFQVKINGQRVELGEIEAALSSLEGIDGAAVIVRKDEADSQMLCAFYTGKEIAGTELRSMLSRSLPRYMLPQAFTHLREMPLNTSGKTDRKVLASAEITAQAEIRDYEPPKTAAEEEICRLYGNMLGVERVGRNDNFYDFGGTSLQLVQLLSCPPLDALSASDFLSDPTPAGLAKKLDETAKTDYNYIVPLYMPQNAENAMILFPYAGGDASAYTALVAKAREEKSDIALLFVDWPDKDNIQKIEDEIRMLTKKLSVGFYSHCAGCAIALELLDGLNAQAPCICGYVAGASIPPVKALAGFNVWTYLSDARIAKALKRAGLRLETEDDGLLHSRLDAFRRHTQVWYEYFHRKEKKTNIEVTVVVSKNDPLTRDYAKAEARWRKAVTDVKKVILIETPTHYFHNTDAELLLKTFSELSF